MPEIRKGKFKKKQSHTIYILKYLLIVYLYKKSRNYNTSKIYV